SVREPWSQHVRPLEIPHPGEAQEAFAGGRLEIGVKVDAGVARTFDEGTYVFVDVMTDTDDKPPQARAVIYAGELRKVSRISSDLMTNETLALEEASEARWGKPASRHLRAPAPARVGCRAHRSEIRSCDMTVINR